MTDRDKLLLAGFSESDLEDIRARGITFGDILAQINSIRKGIPPIKLIKPCTMGDGIIKLTSDAYHKYIEFHTEGEKQGRFLKFVPASGAASRMFKKLLSIYNNQENLSSEGLRKLAQAGDSEAKAVCEFVDNLENFAFYDDLKNALKKDGIDPENLTKEDNYRLILKYILTETGLNYSNLPKGSIKFHKYSGGSRTAFEEHLAEAVQYSANKKGFVSVHFTLSPEHVDEVTAFLESVRNKFEPDRQKLLITHSTQSPSTDTIALTKQNKPFRNNDGSLLFRPGGHGALLKNLNELEGDIIFIKNIDNVVPEHLRADTILYKKLLAGLLIFLQNKIFGFLKSLKEENLTVELRTDIKYFISEWFPYLSTDLAENKSDAIDYLIRVLNRPLRVCGVVKNVGHPGGGPFWVLEDDGSVSLQIVESAQIDGSDESQVKFFNSSTHFNPVDLVCGVKDFQGKSFNLLKYRNPDTGLVTVKSKDGDELKALELPGLWNGSMAYWNTVFVEVPLSTFAPVKEVNDLLKKEHQPSE
ncbi:MAG: DUF4301 family protein [Ignavibacteriaceae bacterium]